MNKIKVVLFGRHANRRRNVGIELLLHGCLPGSTLLALLFTGLSGPLRVDDALRIEEIIAYADLSQT